MNSEMDVPKQGETQMVKSNGTQLILPNAQNKLAENVIKNIDKFRQPLLSLVSPEEFLHAIVVAANEIDPKDHDAEPSSLLRAAFNSCRLRLMPGAALGLAYFVPFKNKKKNNQKEIQLIPGYRGYIHLAYANRFLSGLHTDVVLRGEELTQHTDENGPHFNHDTGNPLERVIEKKNIIGAYCWYQVRGGKSGVKFVNRADLDKASSDTPAWNYSFAEMAMKTPIRRAAKLWKITPEMGNAILLDEQAERGEQQHVINGEFTVEPQKTAPEPSYDDYDETTETDDEREARLEREALQAEQEQAREYQQSR